MTEHEFHEAKARLAFQKFTGDDNPLTGETDEYGTPLRVRSYFEIAKEITDDEVAAFHASQVLIKERRK